MPITIQTGDAVALLRAMPADSVHCVVTSPPYWGLRDYGTPPQIWGGDPDWRGSLGLEPTYQLYIDHLVAVLREVRRVLRPDGTLWLVIGDCYASGSGGDRSIAGDGRKDPGKAMARSRVANLKPKDLVGIPWRVAFALQEDGWWLRRDNIWSKPNPMPESTKDRCTSAHEYVFHLTKSARYYFDHEAIKEPASGRDPGNKGHAYASMGGTKAGLAAIGPVSSRHKRSVWTIATSPFPEAHFATFPPALVEPCILAGTSERGVCPGCGAPWTRVTKKGGINSSGGRGKRYHEARMDVRELTENRMAMTARDTVTIGWRPTCSCAAGAPIPATVLDPFLGAGTTALVADRLGRDCIGLELSPAYAAMARRRTRSPEPRLRRAA